MSNNKKCSSVVGIQLLKTCIEWMISKVLSKKGNLCEILMYKANVATPPPISSPILMVPGFFTASTSSMEKSRLPLMLGPVQRGFSRPPRSKQSLQSSKPF